MTPRSHIRPLVTAGMILGMGMGGFVDGIVFHQIFQLHNMLSSRFPVSGLDPEQIVVNLEINMFWDGLFHAATWILTAVGIGMLWAAAGRQNVPHSTRALLGSLSLGWGLFNLVEGLINHHLLQIHHVVETHRHLWWDLAFLLFGAALVTLGTLLIRSEIPARRPV